MSDHRPRQPPRVRPDGVDDETVAAVGRLSEALEYVERARGHLYSFHQLMGHADLTVGDAVQQLAAAGHREVAERVERELVGRNAIDGRWTFQIVEEFDEQYYRVAREETRRVEDQLVDGVPHLFESEMKERRRTHGDPGHEARPPDAHDPEVETRP